MATVESSDMEVVAELGVPLEDVSAHKALYCAQLVTYGASEGVAGSAGGGGRLMKVGV